MPVADQCGNLVRLLQDAARMLNHALPDRGEGYEPRGALHQRNAEPLFQFPQLAAQCGLGNAAAFRRSTEVPQVRDRDEIAQLSKGQWYFPYLLRLLMKSHL